MIYATVCLVVILIIFALYVFLDGKALSLCLFIPFCDKKQKVRVYNAILPSWDANQTWLVFTMAALYGGFSSFFGQVLSSLYLCFIGMLILLIFRGAAIEFSMKDAKRAGFWYAVLSLSSLAILCLQSFVVVYLILAQQIAAFDLQLSWSAKLGYYSIAIAALLLFHMIRALEHIQFNTKWLQASYWMLVLPWLLVGSLMCLDAVTGFQHIRYMDYHLIAYAVILVVGMAISAIYRKGCVQCYCSLVALLSVAVILLYLYPFHSLFGKATLLQMASAPLNLKIIAISSCVMLPLLFISMQILNRVFRQTEDAVGY